jgi:hypothetical protein
MSIENEYIPFVGSGGVTAKVPDNVDGSTTYSWITVAPDAKRALRSGVYPVGGFANDILALQSTSGVWMT